MALGNVDKDFRKGTVMIGVSQSLKNCGQEIFPKKNQNSKEF